MEPGALRSYQHYRDLALATIALMASTGLLMALTLPGARTTTMPVDCAIRSLLLRTGKLDWNSGQYGRIYSLLAVE